MGNGDLKAEDYARALLDRAQHLKSLNAFRTLDEEMLLEAARAADKVRACGDAIGALHGLPIPAKDSVNSKALPTLNVAMARNTSLASCASMASLILPAGMTSNGLPVGLEFDALMGNDRAVLALGLSLENMLGPIPGPGP